jgi:hypothetical protein
VPKLAAPRRPKTLDDIRNAIYGDLEAACATLYSIDQRDGSGLKNFDLWAHQRRMFRALQRQRQNGEPPRLLCLKTRRAGTSTASAVYTFHETYWRPRRHGLVVAHHESTTSFLYSMYRTFYEELPEELQQPLQKLNRKEIACEPPWASSIIAQTAGYLDIGRGMTVQHAHLSEIDFYGDPETALDGILNTVALHRDTSIIIESTANGADGWLGHFWKESMAGRTGFAPLFQAWFDVPEHRLEVPSSNDWEPNVEEREQMQAFSLDREQMYWYHRKRQETIAKEPWGGDRKMKQEYPFTWQEAFQSSGYCVFPDVVLAHQVEQIQEPRACYQLRATGSGQHVLLPAEPERADFWVWEEPKEDAFYSLGVDIGGGVGRTESVVNIFRYPGYAQVACWASKNTSVDGTAFIARWLGEFYGGPRALICPEINKDGPMILYILTTLPMSCEVFRWRYLDKIVNLSTDNPKLGWECVAPSARVLTADLRWVPAADLVVGDELIGCAQTSETRRTNPLRRQRIISRRVFDAPRVEITLTNGATTIVSANHPLWTDRSDWPQWRWAEASTLRPTNLVKHLPTWETLTSYDAGWLAGILDGEGHLSRGKNGGLRMQTTQAEGPLAEDIVEAWRRLGFAPLCKSVRHRSRPWEKPLSICGPARTVGALRALGSLRPRRLLRRFVDDYQIENLTLATLPTVRIASVRPIGVGPVIGLTTDPDHTLIADGIVGHNTTDSTKNILAQVANLVMLRGLQGSGEGAVRDNVLLEQMRRCTDIKPGRRWAAVGGLSDRIIAALIAITAAYLEFEGGSVANLHGPVDPKKANAPPVRWREPGSFDAADDIFDEVMHGHHTFERPKEDYE